MSHEVTNDVSALWNELKIAYDKAIQRFPDRADETDAVFSAVDNLRSCIIQVDGIAKQKTPHGPLSVGRIDELHSILWSNIEAFVLLSLHSKELFTWRDTPVSWRGKPNSNIVEAIQNEALQYSWVLQNASLRKTLAPSDAMRELHPDPWFDISGAQDVARTISERMPVETQVPSQNLWTPEEETEARRLINANTVKTAKTLREMLSMNQAASQALFRHITGRKKKEHRID